MFDKILIANRGEIACRIIRTAKLLNIKTVAVFSEADKNSLHVNMADEAYFIGPAPSNQSYLNMEKIARAAKCSGAQAVHPGYGFLSENYRFAELLEQSKIPLIGPTSAAIKSMGSKRYVPSMHHTSESKAIMIDARVPVVPGYHGDDQSASRLEAEASAIGFPVMIKASLGGGGRGMRIVESKEKFKEMLESAKRESLKSFGDDKVILEKYIPRSRHIEVQIFGDKYGQYVYLFERDCSVQRRHQKVLEEAPAFGLTDKQRTEIGLQAVEAAKAVKYVGAGTVEFIWDCDTSKFYFMEMNTRLQVEHPVTEMITGIDLVEWQLVVASGGRLPRSQSQISSQGVAIEARIYAENPANDFLPDTGSIVEFHVPESDGKTIRIESSIKRGDLISVFYDPMIAKVIAWGVSRKDAIKKLDWALENSHILGVHTNKEFVRQILSLDEFQNDSVDTSLLSRHKNLTALCRPQAAEVLAFASIYLSKGSMNFWDNLSGFGICARSEKILSLVSEDQIYDIRYCFGDGVLALAYAGVEARAEVTRRSDCEFDCLIADRMLSDIRFFTHSNGAYIRFKNGKSFSFSRSKKAEKEDSGSSGVAVLKAPMPCKIVSVNVRAGDAVTKGAALAVLEAMKMEYTIKAPQNGQIRRVQGHVGQFVEEKFELFEIEL